MTDHHDPDELASAHLDGATSADEAARVSADPALRARVESLRAVRAAIRRPVPVDAEARDAAIAAALDAFDDPRTAPARPAGGTVTPITPRRSLSPTARRVLGAAAAAAVLALLVPLLASSGDDDQSADAAFEETGASIGDAESAGDGEAQAGADRALTSTTAPIAPSGALGHYDDVDELMEALDRDDARFAPRSDDASNSPEALSGSGCSTDRVAGAAEVGVAVVAGRDVVVALFRDDERLRVVVIDAETCEVVADREV